MIESKDQSYLMTKIKILTIIMLENVHKASL